MTARRPPIIPLGAHRELTSALTDDPRRLPCLAGEPLSEAPEVRDHVATTLCPSCHVKTLCRDAGKRETFGVWGGVDRSPRRSVLTPDAPEGAKP